MAKVYNLTSSKKIKPKKETIEFILNFSKSQASIISARKKRFRVCVN